MSKSGGWGVYCPGCKRTLQKSFWRKCQWNADGGRGSNEGGDPWGGVNFTQCKECQPDPLWITDPEGLKEVLPKDLMDRLSALVAKCQPKQMQAFIDDWMEMNTQFVRKGWSYLGCVKGCHEGDMLGFDPGNWVYSWVLGLLCPSLMEVAPWNIETKGDICEAMLALHDDLRRVPRDRAKPRDLILSSS